MEVHVEVRVAERLLDVAAMASEHGDEILADMLTAESRALRDGRVKVLAERAGRGKSHVGISMPEIDDEDPLGSLRTMTETRTAFAEKRKQADRAIQMAWLMEGYTV